MSDKYYNAYVDSAVGVIHEYVSMNLQLKAQVRVANELLAEKDRLLIEKDNFINSLQNDINVVKSVSSENDKLKNDAKYWEDSYHGMMNKVSHMETLTAQFNDMKKQFLSKCEELESLNAKYLDKCAEVETLKAIPIETKTIEVEPLIKPSKKVINNKSPVTQIRTVETNLDDF